MAGALRPNTVLTISQTFGKRWCLFLETAWLLIYGELPTQSQRDEFSRQIRKHTLTLRAPKAAGVYRLYVEAAGHAAKALVVVA